MKKILVVEDDVYLRNDIKKILSMNDYEVCTACNKNEAMQYFSKDNNIDLFLLDVMLPDGNGFDLCKEIRAFTMEPVIFLTCCDDEESIISGLNSGADDYITKPFRTTELLARIQAHLRRQSLNAGIKKFTSGDLIIDMDNKEISTQGGVMVMTPLEYQLMQMFISNPGIILKREMFLEKIWDNNGNFIEDSSLTVYISRLREKLGNYKNKPYIETVRGFGYRWGQKINCSLRLNV